MNKTTARNFQQKFTKYKHLEVKVYGRYGVIGVWVPVDAILRGSVVLMVNREVYSDQKDHE